MSRSQTLLQSMRDNVTRIDAVIDNIEEIRSKETLNENDIKTLESLYRAEFSLYLDNSSIYDDLIESIEGEAEFMKRLITKEAGELLKSEIIEIGGN